MVTAPQPCAVATCAVAVLQTSAAVRRCSERRVRRYQADALSVGAEWVRSIRLGPGRSSSGGDVAGCPELTARRLPPRPEASGPLRADGSPCRFPGCEPVPVEHPPAGPCQAQQHDPQRDRGGGRRGDLVGQHLPVGQRRADRRARRVHPQPDSVASGHVNTDRDLAGPDPPAGCGPPSHGQGISGNPFGGGRRRGPQQEGGNLCQERSARSWAAPQRDAQPAAAADSNGAPAKNAASSRAAAQAAILSIRRRNGLPSTPSLRASRDAFMPGPLLPGDSRRGGAFALFPALEGGVGGAQFARPPPSSCRRRPQ